MKELSIEEKAKAYDEAIKRAKTLYDNNQPISGSNVIINNIFPELKESGDERIRKMLIKFFGNGAFYDSYTNGISDRDIVAWLEKQGEHQKFANNIVEIWKDMRLEVYQQASGNRHEPNYSDDTTKMYSLNDIDEIIEKMSEQKPADKVEPKFKVGDWVVSPNGVYWHIDRIENNRYEVTSDTGKCADWALDTDLYHLWTIQDAKKGDVIACDKCILIFDQLSEFNNEQVLMDICHCTSKGFYWQDTKDRDLWALDGFKPATKEQRDTLFAKMHEAGYKWDAEKKELKIIEQKPADDIETSDKYEGLTDFERTLADICIGWTGERVGWKQYVKDNADILLKFKHKPAWSEVDEEIYSRICYLIHSAAFENYDVDEVGKELGEYAKITDWLKTIKDRVQPQPQQEWSEEDDKNLEKTIWYVEKGGKLIFAKTDELVSWLKSLRPQNRWKPSEKQMEALKDACDEHWEPDGLDPLYTLYQELKKLREE